MAELQKKIEADLRSAMKNKEGVRLDTLRMFKSELQYEMNRTGAKELSDEEVQNLLKRSVKKRKDSIEQFRSAGRNELAEKEAGELVFLEEYLPASLSREEVEAHLKEVLVEVKPSGPSDTGKVMGALMKRLKGQNVDGSLVKALVDEHLKM